MREQVQEPMQDHPAQRETYDKLKALKNERTFLLEDLAYEVSVNVSDTEHPRRRKEAWKKAQKIALRILAIDGQLEGRL